MHTEAVAGKISLFVSRSALKFPLGVLSEKIERADGAAVVQL